MVASKHSSAVERELCGGALMVSTVWVLQQRERERERNRRKEERKDGQRGKQRREKEKEKKKKRIVGRKGEKMKTMGLNEKKKKTRWACRSFYYPM